MKSLAEVTGLKERELCVLKTIVRRLKESKVWEARVRCGTKEVLDAVSGMRKKVSDGTIELVMRFDLQEDRSLDDPGQFDPRNI